ncbi:hypothetical protein WN55_00807 [Dufourea novaeangliae]|uniref:Uncharacterized protein n=1 Tax=Dufourea novaeangliae TaxID=178035 RepID=A0A154PE28_DUFNO|nr:hypothetical protein WN55_00807 [Dufourea novaeangliae]
MTDKSADTNEARFTSGLASSTCKQPYRSAIAAIKRAGEAFLQPRNDDSSSGRIIGHSIWLFRITFPIWGREETSRGSDSLLTDTSWNSLDSARELKRLNEASCSVDWFTVVFQSQIFTRVSNTKISDIDIGPEGSPNPTAKIDDRRSIAAFRNNSWRDILIASDFSSAAIRAVRLDEFKRIEIMEEGITECHVKRKRPPRKEFSRSLPRLENNGGTIRHGCVTGELGISLGRMPRGVSVVLLARYRCIRYRSYNDVEGNSRSKYGALPMKAGARSMGQVQDGIKNSMNSDTCVIAAIFGTEIPGCSWFVMNFVTMGPD